MLRLRSRRMQCGRTIERHYRADVDSLFSDVRGKTLVANVGNSDRIVRSKEMLIVCGLVQ